MAFEGLGGESGALRRLGVAVGLVGMGQLLLPLVVRAVFEFPGPWSGTVVAMVWAFALLVPAVLLWMGVRPRAALWAVGILGTWALFRLPSTVQFVVDAPSTSVGVVEGASLLVEVATVTVGVLAVRHLDLRPAGGPSGAGWVAAAGAATFALSQLFSNVTVAFPTDMSPEMEITQDVLSSPFQDLFIGPWTLTVAILGAALIAAAAAVAVASRVAPALAVPVALLPDTVANMLNDTVVRPMPPDASGPEMTVALAAGGWLNILALLVLVAAAALAVRDHGHPPDGVSHAERPA